MRKALLASLALSPVLLHAQANSPAPTRNVLESRLTAPASLAAAGDRNSAVQSHRISTGVVAPQLIQSFPIPLDSSTALRYSIPQLVVVGMVVGTDGTPSDLKIVQSAGTALDKNVLAAVSQYRFKPGTVSSQPTAIPLNLEITIVGSSIR